MKSIALHNYFDPPPTSTTPAGAGGSAKEAAVPTTARRCQDRRTSFPEDRGMSFHELGRARSLVPGEREELRRELFEFRRKAASVTDKKEKIRKEKKNRYKLGYSWGAFGFVGKGFFYWCYCFFASVLRLLFSWYCCWLRIVINFEWSIVVSESGLRNFFLIFILLR